MFIILFLMEWGITETARFNYQLMGSFWIRDVHEDIKSLIQHNGIKCTVMCAGEQVN